MALPQASACRGLEARGLEVRPRRRSVREGSSSQRDMDGAPAVASLARGRVRGCIRGDLGARPCAGKARFALAMNERR
eukprot:2634929-Pyramimonas_sp.AAC.1